MKKTSMITLIATFSLIGLLIVATIIAGFSTKSFMPQFASPNSISYAYDSGSLQSVNAGDADYVSLKASFENAFNKSFLTAMFDGSNKKEITATNTASTTVSQTGTYLRLDYLAEQTLVINGEEFVNGSGVAVKYTSIWVTAKNEAGFKTLNMYLTNSILYPSTPTRYVCYVSTIAHTQDLFEAIKEMATRHNT